MQGFKKLRFLEVVFSCRLDIYLANPRPVWETQMKDHAVTILGNIQGHGKVLKMSAAGIFSRWNDIHSTETQITAIP